VTGISKSTTCFGRDSGYWTAFEVLPTRCSGWHLPPFHNFIITSAIGIVSRRKLITKIW